MQEFSLVRVFRYKALDLIDPNGDLTPEEVLDHYSKAVPQAAWWQSCTASRRG